MVQINFAKKNINLKIVYYGPGLSGKTTNMEVIHKLARGRVGELTSLQTEGDRTLFFDYVPLQTRKIATLSVKVQLYTVPGSCYYNATRKLLLQGSDGIIFVADSRHQRMEENLESFANLRENLKEQGLVLSTIPLVMQFNKRDLHDIDPCSKLNSALNKYHAPSFEAVAVQGRGVFPSVTKAISLISKKLNVEYGITEGSFQKSE